MWKNWQNLMYKRSMKRLLGYYDIVDKAVTDILKTVTKQHGAW